MADEEPAFEVGEPLYLPSPEEGVEILTEVIEESDCDVLARYYDFSEIDELEEPGVNVYDWPEPDASWFTNAHAPHVAIAESPIELFRHPFPPTFEYVEHEVDGDVARVVVEGSWTSGTGEVVQAGRWAFKMIRHAEGWQVLPDPVEVIEEW